MCTNLTSGGGVVQSPNFPGDYGNKDRYCNVRISTPEGWMIQLKFTTVNLETNIGYVEVYNDQIYMLPITGNTIPTAVATTTNSLDIDFQSTASNKSNSAIYNWQATFSVTGQGSSCSVSDSA
ncbi:hypothetical protein DAPPUDRAFT_338007, partial [Daphnia pulex]